MDTSTHPYEISGVQPAAKVLRKDPACAKGITRTEPDRDSLRVWVDGTEFRLFVAKVSIKGRKDYFGQGGCSSRDEIDD